MSGLPFYFGKLKKTGESFSAVTGFFWFLVFLAITHTHLPPSTATPPAHINAPTPQHPALRACPTLLAGAVGHKAKDPLHLQVVRAEGIQRLIHQVQTQAKDLSNPLQCQILCKGNLQILYHHTCTTLHLGDVGNRPPAKQDVRASDDDLVHPEFQGLLGTIRKVHLHGVLPIQRLCRPGGGKANLMNESHLANRKERGMDRKGQEGTERKALGAKRPGVSTRLQFFPSLQDLKQVSLFQTICA